MIKDDFILLKILDKFLSIMKHVVEAPKDFVWNKLKSKEWIEMRIDFKVQATFSQEKVTIFAL